MTKKIKTYGLIGYPLVHSMSETLHKLLFDIKKNKNLYELYPVEKKDLNESLDVLRHTLSGFNITVPYKQDILPFLDYISPEAKIIGSVNTVKTAEGFLSGYNTDIDGLEYCFKIDEVSMEKKPALVIGCGGMALTAVYFLKKNNAKITVCGRDMQKLIKFQKQCLENFKANVDIASIKNLTGSFEIVVNCTPVGMNPRFDEMPIIPKKIDGVCYYFDSIYNPRKTLLYKNFEKDNVKCRDGLLMLAVQAAKAQEIWEDVKFSEIEINKVYFNLALDMFKSLAIENINKICLTGFMGAGKSTVGKKLAKLLDFSFIDTDDLVEKKYGKITSIFKTLGEKQFREYETEMLNAALKNKNVVIATGGGAVEKNSVLIKEKVYTIYLDCKFNELANRAANKSRPLFKNLSEAEALYKKRLPLYEKCCHLKVNGEDTIDNVLLNIFSSI